MSNKNEINILIPNDPLPLDFEMSKNWPINTKVNFIKTEYINYKPEPIKLKNIDILIGTDFTLEMSKYANRLKAIFIPAAGYERINPDALPDGTIVANAYHHEAPISEWVMMVATALDHNLIKSHLTFANGSWCQWPARLGPYSELYNKTFGIIGLGNIGMRVAKLALAYDMKVRATGRTQRNFKNNQPEIEYHDGKKGIDEVMTRSDFVLISTPLNKMTQDLINERELKSMKKTAYIINVARGHIINEESLYYALKNRTIAGAAIDTWYIYPEGKKDEPRPSKFPFWELDNLIMTPHHSGATIGTMKRRYATVAENIDRFVTKKPILNVIENISKN